MPGIRGCGSFHYRSPILLQRGSGFGGFFKGTYNLLKPLLFPALKSVAKVGTSVVKDVVASEAVQDAVGKVKKRALTAGMNVVTNALAGRDVKAGLEDDIREGGEDIASVIGRAVVGERKRKGGKKKSVPAKKRQRQRRRNIFDED
jgi:hypothetical protein